MSTIKIRRTEPDDYRAIQAILSQPQAIWGTLQVPFPSADAWRRRLSEHSEDWYALVAVRDGNVVGNLGLHLETQSPRRRHAASLGMAVHEASFGQGVGTALLSAALNLADNWLNLTRLELDVFTDNEPAIALYKKLGFEVEGTLRQYAYRAGAFVDAYCMARLRH